jgi:hypothetical protein
LYGRKNELARVNDSSSSDLGLERRGLVKSQTAARVANAGAHLPPTAKPARSNEVTARDNLSLLIDVSPLNPM